MKRGGTEPMTKAIETRYLGPTDDHGTRIRALSSKGHGLVLAWDYELNDEGNHVRAARALAENARWFGSWVGASTREGFLFVPVTSAVTFTVPES
jgi:hypothetical protein